MITLFTFIDISPARFDIIIDYFRHITLAFHYFHYFRHIIAITPFHAFAFCHAAFILLLLYCADAFSLYAIFDAAAAAMPPCRWPFCHAIGCFLTTPDTLPRFLSAAAAARLPPDPPKPRRHGWLLLRWFDAAHAAADFRYYFHAFFHFSLFH
jgi:hypothetical protein